MKITFFTICLAALFTATAAWCQSDKSAAPASGNTVSPSETDQSGSTQNQTQNGSQPASEPQQPSDVASENGRTATGSGSPNTAWLPNAVNGETGSLAFLGNGERSDVISAGVTVSSSYDDNTLSDNTHKVGNVGYMLTPTIALHESRPRTDVTLSYDPGLMFNQRLSPNYSMAHNADLNYQYRLTEHLTTRFNDHLRYGATSFGSLLEAESEPVGSALHQPNVAVVTPLTNQLINVSGLDVIDQTGRGTMIGATGYFSRLHFVGASANSSALADNQSWSGDAFYSTRLSRRNSIGLTYTFQNIATYGQFAERAQSYSGLVFYTLYPESHMNVSLFAGPSYTTDDLGSTTSSSLQPHAGAILNWQTSRTSLQFSGVRDISDGGGLSGTVRRYAVNAGVRRQLTRTWTGTFQFNYSSNHPLNGSSAQPFDSVTGMAGIERTFARAVSVSVLYGRQHQSSHNQSAFLPNFATDHNQAWISISYHFSHPLGM